MSHTHTETCHRVRSVMSNLAGSAVAPSREVIAAVYMSYREREEEEEFIQNQEAEEWEECHNYIIRLR